MVIIIISLILSGALGFWIILIDRKYAYRARIIKALPPSDSLFDYQKGVCEINRKISPDTCLNEKKKQKRYFSILGEKYKGFWIPFWSVVYRLFSSKYFAYNQFPLVYISSYGGISEVSRRTITSEVGLKKLMDLRERLRAAVANNDKAEIILNLADVYRFMYGLNKDNSIDSMRVGYIADGLAEVSAYMAKKDLVNAYICWRAKEKLMVHMSDMEIIIYGSIRLHLEKYIISYEYPVDSVNIEQDIKEFANMLKATEYWISMKLLQKVKLFSDLSVIMMLDLLGSRIKYDK
jgi:hypothetical protein